MQPNDVRQRYLCSAAASALSSYVEVCSFIGVKILLLLNWYH